MKRKGSIQRSKPLKGVIELLNQWWDSKNIIEGVTDKEDLISYIMNKWIKKVNTFYSFHWVPVAVDITRWCLGWMSLLTPSGCRQTWCWHPGLASILTISLQVHCKASSLLFILPTLSHEKIISCNQSFIVFPLLFIVFCNCVATFLQ